MAKLLLIRHCKARFQTGDRFWGSTDIELNEEGIAQAERLRERLAAEKVDLIYTSTLGRARATAGAIAQGRRVEVVECDELRECDFGYVEGLTFGEISQRYPALAQNLMAQQMVSFPGGESLEQLDARVQKFTARLNQHKEEETIAIVSHGGPLRLMVCRLLGLGSENWLKIRLDHASLSVVETHGHGAVLNSLNDISHLKG